MRSRMWIAVVVGALEACVSTSDPTAPPACAGKCDGGGGGTDAGSGNDGGDGGATDLPVQAVPLTGLFGGSEYTASVTVGGETFTMEIDTGSTTMVVASSACASCTGVSPLYMPGAAAIDEHLTAMTTYADDSSFAGEIYRDQVGLGTTTQVPLDFVAMSTQHAFFTDNTIQGLIGLGPADLEDPGTTSVVGALVAAGAAPELAVQLCADRGQLWLGGYDPAFTTASPQYSPMLAMSASDPFYSVAVADIAIGGASTGFSAAADHSALIDTGTWSLVVPPAIKRAIVTAVQGSPGFSAAFGTQTFAQAPDGCVTPNTGVTAAQLDATLPPLALALADDHDGSFTVTLAASQSYLLAYDGTYCLAVTTVPGFDHAILGDAILRRFVTIIDLAGHRVGFAPATDCPPSASVSPVRESSPSRRPF